MTHKDIYTKFMIEYDKANVTSSYPSLTEYEVATVLDKAYNALIAQKVTGNNVRRAPLEADIKAVSDIQPLIQEKNATFGEVTNDVVTNRLKAQLDTKCLYFIEAYLKHQKAYTTGHGPKDGKEARLVLTKLVDHATASKFFSSASNMPWVKIPVTYIENNDLYVVYDPLNPPVIGENNGRVVFVKKPNVFVKDLSDLGLTLQERAQMAELTYFDYKFIQSGTTGYDAAQQTTADAKLVSAYTFECTDTMAEELISLAIAFALENVESQRLNTKLNMRGLEA